VFIPDRVDGVDVDRYGYQLIVLNLLISITVWVESLQLGLMRWKVIGCYLQLLCLAAR